MTDEKIAIITSPEFLKQVYDKVWMYRIKAMRTKRERREYQVNLDIFRYFTLAIVRRGTPSGIQIELYRSRHFPTTEFAGSWLFMCRMNPDFTILADDRSTLSESPMPLYQRDGSPPLWP
jgi:hypothetical protein